MLSKKIVTVVTIASVLSLGIARAALAWSATSLGGGLWAITCANGTVSSYSGTSAGLDTVGPSTCPNGISSINPVGGGKSLESAIKTPDKVFIKGIEAENGPKEITPGTNKVRTTSVVLPKGVTRGIPANVDLAILQNRKEIGDPGIQSVIASYPPKGYPCLGCKPCDNNPKDFCDIATNARVVIGLPDGWEQTSKTPAK